MPATSAKSPRASPAMGSHAFWVNVMGLHVGMLATGVVAVLFLYGILDYFAEAFFIGTWLYLLIGWTLSIIRLIAGKRSKALADFEPDDQDD